ncbi:MAG: autotransporter outer membrane beta-barrel domain-containing protein, partial [Geopsychrobacter sp.]|nr:autotransporter outer membrane beta-barrel domain-containing protein [Geopsychrobacter sp.]
NFTSITLDAVRPYTQSLLGRLQTVRLTGKVATGIQQSISLSGGDRVLLAFNGSDASLLKLFGPAEQPTEKYGFWLNGFGQKGNRTAGDGYDGYQFSSHGVMIGFDSLLSRKALGGVSLGYTQTDLDVDSGQSDGNIDSLHGSLYGSYFSDTLYIDGVVSYASQDYTNKRLTRVLSIDRLASSQHDGHLWSAYAETGYSHKIQQWLVQPFAALNYSYLDEEGFSETGAGVLSLRVENRSTESLVSDLGGRLARVFDTSTGILTAELSASWNYDFSIDDQIIIASFAGAPGGSFAIRGRKPERNGVLFGFSLNSISNSGVYASLQFNKEYRKEYQSLSTMGTLRIAF